MKNRLLQFASLAAVLSLNPASCFAALSASDFYCREIPVQVPAYFKTQVKNCVGGPKAAANAEQSMCVENAYCTFVDDTTKSKLVRNAVGKQVKFTDLASAERTKYLTDNVAPSDWLPSTITCLKITPAGSTECPALDHCKGDINYGWYPATYSPEKTVQYVTTPAVTSGAFQNVEDAPAKEGVPAK